MRELACDLIVVDDSKANLRLLCDMLGREGYATRPFVSSAQALEAALRSPPALFILDVSVPDIDGYELCRRLKADKRTADAPVIFLSALNRTEEIVEGFRCGAVDYITKPFQVEEVATRVRTQIELQRARMELSERNQALQETLDRLKETQAQLVHSEKMASLGVLTAGVAHEINNPVNFMAGSATVVKRKLGKIRASEAMVGRLVIEEEDLVALEEALEGLEDGSRRIAEIVDGLKTYARLDQEGVDVYRVRENVEATVRLFKHALKQGLRLDLDFGKCPDLLGNPGRLNQVIANLLGNAIQAVNDSPLAEKVVRVYCACASTPERPGRVAICVEDNGVGVPEAHRERIFEPFFTSREPGQGLGLGLSISRSIAEAHGGTLELEALPGGSRFKLILPVRDRANAACV